MEVQRRNAGGFVPSLVSWNLTRRCNLACPHCYLSAGEKGDDELTSAECMALLDEMRSLGTEMVILTGGEPLLRRDIYDIAEKASGLGMWVVMGTNGVLVTDRVAGKMVDCGVRGVAVSIDSVDPEKHNRFRGGPNAWELSVRAIDTCRRHGLEVIVQSTVMAMNYDEIPELMRFARDREAWSFNLYFLVRTGRGNNLNDLGPNAIHEMLQYLVDVQDEQRPMLVRSKCAPQFKQIAWSQGKGGLESGGCMAGTQYCRITPEGDVTPCPYMDVAAGNVRESSFTTIWNSSPVLRQLRDPSLLTGKCGACEFKEMCGGCRCRAVASSGDYLAEDPACMYEPTGEPLSVDELLWESEASDRLDRIPIRFIRSRVRSGVEAYARRHGVPVVTMDVMTRAIAGASRERPFGIPNVEIPS